MPDVDLQQIMQTAVDHHRAGRLAEAEPLYRQILSVHPDYADALHLLGIVANQTGHHEAAVQLIGRAVELNPVSPEYNRNLAAVLRAALDAALVLRTSGRLPQAISQCQRLAALQPGSAEAHGNLGMLLHEAGQFESAIAECRRAIQLRGNYAEAHANLGVALRLTGRLDEAIESYRRAIGLGLDVAELHYNLGNGLVDQGDPEAAVIEFRRAVQLKPDFLEGWINLGASVRNIDPVESADCCRRVLQWQPNSADAHLNLGVALQEQLQLPQALDCYRRALEIDRNEGKAHWNRGLILLMLGNYEEGWPEHEWRYTVPSLSPRHFPEPRWVGDDPAGKTVLIHTEQGFGDVIQCCRYVPLLAAKGARVLLECRQELVRLVSGLPGIAQVITFGDALPAFDLHVPVMGIPRAFGTTLEKIPATVPYLQAPKDLVQKWKDRIGAASGLKVGLVWAGNKTPYARRTCGLTALAPLATVPGISFYSLQVGEGASEARTPPPGMQLIDYTSELSDFAETASLVENLDLIITIDSALAHLSGALGKPTWVMLSYAGDWRWLLDRADSPWYPTMRLFRQSFACNWASVVQQIQTTLVALTTNS